MARYDITIADTGERYLCRDDRSLLEGMQALGRRGIPVGCCNGGCGVCKVRVITGQFRSRVMSRAHVSVEEEQTGIVLACCIYPLSDTCLSIIGLMHKSVCRSREVETVAKAAEK